MNVGTHNGTFHADEVLACTILDMLYGPISLVRTRDTTLLEECDVVVDVGVSTTVLSTLIIIKQIFKLHVNSVMYLTHQQG